MSAPSALFVILLLDTDTNIAGGATCYLIKYVLYNYIVKNKHHAYTHTKYFIVVIIIIIL